MRARTNTRTLMLRVCAQVLLRTWGDSFYIGLNGIEVSHAIAIVLCLCVRNEINKDIKTWSFGHILVCAVYVL